MALGKINRPDSTAIIKKNAVAVQTQSGMTIPFYANFVSKKNQISTPKTFFGVGKK